MPDFVQHAGDIEKEQYTFCWLHVFVGVIDEEVVLSLFFVNLSPPFTAILYCPSGVCLIMQGHYGVVLTGLQCLLIEGQYQWRLVISFLGCWYLCIVR